MSRLLISEVKPGEVDKLWALIVLAHSLSGSDETDVFMPNWETTKKMASHLPLGNLRFIEKVDPQNLTITIKRNGSKVKEVKWEENDEQIKVFIYTEIGKINTSDYIVKPTSNSYTDVFAFGIPNQGKLGSVINNLESITEHAELHNIDRNTKNERYAKYNFVQPETRSYAELVNNYLKHHDIELKQSSATLLLAALLWRTHNLTNEQTASESFTMASELLTQGASLSQANKWVRTNRSLNEIKMLGKMLTGVELVADNKVVVSKIADTMDISIENLVHPSQNLLAELYGPTHAIILYAISPTVTLARITSKEPLSQVRRLLREYSPWTTPDSIMLRLEQPLQSVQTSLVKKLVGEEVEKPIATNAVPLSPATEKITPEPAVEPEIPKPLFGAGGAANPFGPA